MTIIVFDPLNTGNQHSHHISLYSYLEKHFSNIDIPFKYTVPWNNKSRFRILRVLKGSTWIFFNFLQMLKLESFKKTKIIFLPNLDSLSLVLCMFCRKLRLFDKKIIARTIGINDLLASPTKKAKIYQYILKKLIIEEDVFCSENLVLRERYQRVFPCRNISHLPFPFDVENNIEEINGIKQPNFMFIGRFRFDKGINVVLDLASKLKNFNFYVQESNYFQSKLDLEIPSNLIFFEQPASDQEIYNLLLNTNVALLPYDKELFKLRTSGVLSIALSSGAKIASFNETAIAEEARQFGVFVDIDDIDALSNSLSYPNRQMGENYRSYLMKNWEETFL